MRERKRLLERFGEEEECESIEVLVMKKKIIKVPLEPRSMAGKAAKSVVKAIGEYQYPWREKLAKYKDELSKGVWGYWELGAWKPLGISGRRRARLRKEVLLAGQDWPYDPPRKEMKTKRKGHKCDRVSAEKRANTAELMKKMPEMLLDYKKRRWEKKMKAEDAKDE
ncbi:hypothetical protein Syun_005460 [Stephania yunnanensis]|uniref:Uncharacterized protein n=1 Tax=Stephania yunnanensis TaxID=152371 RepID=A0AAP0Q297_9MAGN